MSRDYTECIMQGLLIAQCLTEGQGKIAQCLSEGQGKDRGQALPSTANQCVTMH